MLIFIFEIIAIFALVICDLLTKAAIESAISLYQSVPIIDNVVNFTYVRNTGAAFSMLSGQMWLFYIMTPIVVIGLGLYLWKLKNDKKFEQVCIVMIIAGALGNFYDRVKFQYVRDFIDVQFMDFAVFNVADILLTCGCFMMIGYLIIQLFAEFKKDKTIKELEAKDAESKDASEQDNSQEKND